jgi:hypothetical protein
MSDSLNNIEIEILDVLYKRECDGDIDFKIEHTIFSLVGDATPSQELGFYLEKLKRNNFIDYKESTLLKADGSDNRYRSNVYAILWDGIHISYKGKKFIQEYRLTRIEKTKRSIKKFGYDVLMEIRAKVVSHLATFILGIIASYIYYSLFIK